MLEVSHFYGIMVKLYYREHPPAHFHALYGENEGVVEIESGALTKGNLPKTAAILIDAWRNQHLQELRENWSRAQHRMPILPIPPLE